MRAINACPCGLCASRSDSARRRWMRDCPATDMELAMLAKARRLTGAKLAAMMPAWLKTELAHSRLPAPFKFVPDKAPVYPNIGRASIAAKHQAPDFFTSSNGAKGMPPDITTGEYVKAYNAMTGLREAA